LWRSHLIAAIRLCQESFFQPLARFGLPPFAVLARGAAALAGEVALPVRRAIEAWLPKMPAINPGTERSASSASQCSP